MKLPNKYCKILNHIRAGRDFEYLIIFLHEYVLLRGIILYICPAHQNLSIVQSVAKKFCRILSVTKSITKNVTMMSSQQSDPSPYRQSTESQYICPFDYILYGLIFLHRACMISLSQYRRGEVGNVSTPGVKYLQYTICAIVNKFIF